ncbi:MAG: type VII secretion integral membrane protein EccD, partial [Mycobacterium sp.]|nr:type VII secretion integral membrane protein EccD [Mycobacterium sp.]
MSCRALPSKSRTHGSQISFHPQPTEVLRGCHAGPGYVRRVPKTLCRLTVHAAGAEPSVDLILPVDCPVGVLLPSVVDLALPGSPSGTGPQRWHLNRINGERLETSMTLRQHGIDDGELLLLTMALPPAPRRRAGDPSNVVAAAADHGPSLAAQAAVAAAGPVVVIVTALTLAWSGSTGSTSAPLWTAAALSAGAATGAVAFARSVRGLSVVLSLAAVLFAAVTGFLTVPHAPWAPAVLLTASCGVAVSILLLRMATGDTAMLTALAAVWGAIASTGLIGMTAQVPIAAGGAMLSVLSLAALSAAPKLTVAVAGLGPARPQIGDRRAAAAHRILTGLVVGWSSSATLGVAAVAAEALTAAVPPALAALLAADVGLLLLLRQRSHVDVRRRIGLGASGLCALIAAHTVTVGVTPEYAPWLCAATVIAGVSALHRAATTAAPPTPVVR